MLPEDAYSQVSVFLGFKKNLLDFLYFYVKICTIIVAPPYSQVSCFEETWIFTIPGCLDTPLPPLFCGSTIPPNTLESTIPEEISSGSREKVEK